MTTPELTVDLILSMEPDELVRVFGIQRLREWRDSTYVQGVELLADISVDASSAMQALQAETIFDDDQPW